MRLDAIAEPPLYRPPAPPVPGDRLSLPHLLRALFFDPLRVWDRRHFEEMLVVERSLIGTRLVVSDPALVKWILVDNAANYARDRLQQRLARRFTGRGIFSADGTDWQRQRKALSVSFSAKRIGDFIAPMAAAARDAVRRLETFERRPFDLGLEMASLTVDIIDRTLFGHGLGEPSIAVAENIRKYSDTSGPVTVGDLLGLPHWMPGIGRLAGWRAAATVRRRARRVVAAARAGDPALAGGILSALISSPPAGAEPVFADQVIEDIVANILGAGSDSSAVALTWAMFLLAQVPHVRNALEAEVDAHLARDEPSAETLGKLVWTRAVVEEALRLFPPAPLIGRMSRRADRLNDLEIPAGTTIMIAPWVLHRHARLWRHPDHFDPERFLPGNRDAIPRFAYLPFGAGPRGCLGSAFAMQEATIALALLVKHLRFECAGDLPVRLRQCITLQTCDPIWMLAKRRP